MRMQDVITKLREVNPKVQDFAALLDSKVAKTAALARDASSASTDEGRKALVDALVVASMEAKITFGSLARELLALDEAEKSYTRVFEAGAASAEKADDQPCLPGLEPVDDTTSGIAWYPGPAAAGGSPTHT